jgi:hypothetical protein
MKHGHTTTALDSTGRDVRVTRGVSIAGDIRSFRLPL